MISDLNQRLRGISEHQLAKGAWAVASVGYAIAGRYGTLLSEALTLPGFAVRGSLRIGLARILGQRARSRDYGERYGGYLELSEPETARPGALALIYLGTAVILLTLGVALTLPTIIEAQLLSVSIGIDEFSQEGLQNGLVQQYVSRGEVPALQLWAGVGCWYAAVLHMDEIRDAMDSLRKAPVPGLLVTFWLGLLWPFRIAARIANPLEKTLFFTAGVPTVILWAIVTSLVVKTVL